MTVKRAAIRARRRPRLGLWLAGIYLGMAVGLFVITMLTTEPSKVGLDWIPFLMLAMPWSHRDMALAGPGLLLNAAILWAIGTAVQVLVRNLRGK
ncbi:hypothetical protein [Occallatibacter riparius]|uniref:Uncharacterized protein n=1 Tax=Occallatibacter riparius TaxID=1002689 RepID=A0A9J7BKA9_9BACT|nr:hypothetical protein [Occallatibacter riparius]UWZ82210.1 hypothetical protein MOP44_16695 [Occallatibacter riparius]